MKNKKGSAVTEPKFTGLCPEKGKG